MTEGGYVIAGLGLRTGVVPVGPSLIDAVLELLPLDAAPPNTKVFAPPGPVRFKDEEGKWKPFDFGLRRDLLGLLRPRLRQQMLSFVKRLGHRNW